MAVRVGGLSAEDLHRIPSSTMLGEAREASSSSDMKKVMSAFHMILNMQLGLLLAAGITFSLAFLAKKKKCLTTH